MTVATGGVGTIAFAAFMGAAMGAGSGFAFGGITSKLSGGKFIDGAADGFMWGAIGGAISGGVSAGLGGMASTAANGVSKAVQVTGKFVTENAVDAVVDTVSDVAHGEDFSMQRYAMNLGTSIAFAGVMNGINVKAKDIPIPKKAKNYVNKANSEKGLFLPDEYYKKMDANIQKAITARDAEVARIQTLSKTQQSKIATVVGGVDLRTGDVYVGVKNSSVYKGNATCAEDIVFRGLGGNANANIIMTPAVRPRNGEIIPVCTRCQTKYPVNQFVKGTIFE